MEIVTSLVSNPISLLNLIGLVVIVFFQLVQNGMLKINIGKSSKRRVGSDTYQIQIDDMKDDIKKINDDIKIIKENHLAHIQEDMARVREDISFIKGKLSK